MLLQGTLRGYDQATNLILDECHERVYSSKVGQRVGPAARLGISHAPAASGPGVDPPPRPLASCTPQQSGVEQLVLGLYVIRGDNM